MKIEVGRIGLGCAANQWEGIPRWHLPLLKNPGALGEGAGFDSSSRGNLTHRET